MSDFEQELRRVKLNEAANKKREELESRERRKRQGQESREAEARSENERAARLRAVFEEFIQPIKGIVDGLIVTVGNETWGWGKYTSHFRYSEVEAVWEVGRTQIYSLHYPMFRGGSPQAEKKLVWIPEVNISVSDWKGRYRRRFIPEKRELYRFRYHFEESDNKYFSVPNRDTFCNLYGSRTIGEPEGIGDKTVNVSEGEIKELIKREFLREPAMDRNVPSYNQAYPVIVRYTNPSRPSGFKEGG